MSTAIGVGHIGFSPRLGTFTTAIQCSEGDLSQYYIGNDSNFTCFPDFEAADYPSPQLNFVVISSRVTPGKSTPVSNVRWFFNDTEITFGSNNKSTGIFAGDGNPYFEYVPMSETTGQKYPALKILRNLARIGAWSPITFRAEGDVSVPGATAYDTVQAVFAVSIMERTEDMPDLVKIAAVDSAQGFTITAKNDATSGVTAGSTVKIKAVCYRKGVTLVTNPADLIYRWYRLSAGGWVEITSAGPETKSLSDSVLEIHEADITTTGKYKVEIYSGNSDGTAGSWCGQDTETIVDASDCYMVDFNYYKPATATKVNPYIDGSGVTSVEVKASVKSRKSGSTIIAEPAAAVWSVVDPSGNILNIVNNQPDTSVKTSQIVDQAMVEKAQTGVDVLCEITLPN